MRTWLFVRHAEAVSNAEGWLAGHRDAALTERGREQAEALAPAVAEHAPDRIVTSDLSRAAQTAALLRPPGCPLHVDRRLRERHLGDWEGASRSVLARPETRQRLLGWHAAPPGGESMAETARRVLQCLAALDAPGRHLIVSHATALRSAIGLLDQLGVDAIATWKIPNATLFVRALPEGAFAEALHQLETSA